MTPDQAAELMAVLLDELPTADEKRAQQIMDECDRLLLVVLPAQRPLFN